MAHEKKRTISFLVTTECNLSCRYCVNDIKQVEDHQTIDLDFAKTGIDDFFLRRTDLFGENNNRIKFYGVGEPTTKMDVVKKIKDYAQKIRGENLFVELQTNGAFSRDSAEWIRDNVDEIWVSIDGPPDIQNRNRSNSSDKVVKNIEFLLENDCFVGARATILPQDIHRQTEIVEYLRGLGISWVYAEPEFQSVKQNGSECLESITTVNMKKFLDEFLKAYEFAKEKGMNYGNFFTMNFDEKCNYACRSCLPMPQLNPDGTVSGCDLAYSGKTQLSDFIFGKFDGEKIIYFPEKIERIRQRHVDNIEQCNECEIKTNCGGGCAGLAYYATGNLLGIVPEFCDAVKYLSKHIPKNEGCADHLHP